MTSLEWLQRRNERVLLGEQAPGVPVSGPAPTPEIPNESPMEAEVAPTAPPKWATNPRGPVTPPSRSPINPRGWSRLPREIPDKSPRIPEESLFNLGGKNILSKGGEGEKENILAQGVEMGGLGAPRGFTGILEAETPPVGAGPEPPRPTHPFFTADGTLSIPFGSDPKYFWWQGGQSVKETIAELKAAQNKAQPGGPVDGPAG